MFGRSVQNYVARHGFRFKSTALIREKPEVVAKAWEVAQNYSQFRENECYLNGARPGSWIRTQYITRRNIDSNSFNKRLLRGQGYGGDLWYVHGYYTFPRSPIPIHHGWLSLNRKIVEPTFEIRGIYDENDHGYFGVPFAFNWDFYETIGLQNLNLWTAIVDRCLSPQRSTDDGQNEL